MTVRLPGGRLIAATIMPQLAHVDPMAGGCVPEPAARSPIAPAAPILVMAGWEASGHRASGALTLTDGTPLAKAQIRAACGGQAAAEIGVLFGRAARDRHGTLLAVAGPEEWLLLAPPARARP